MGALNGPLAWHYLPKRVYYYSAFDKKPMLTTSSNDKWTDLLPVQAFNCLSTLACSRFNWQSHKKSLSTTAYVCSRVGFGNSPFSELHFREWGPWKLASRSLLSPSSIRGDCQIVKIIEMTDVSYYFWA